VSSTHEVVPVGRIAQVIYLVRGEKVLMDEDLAQLYGVQTRVLNQAVRRHLDRFPEDFMFRLTGEEFANLKSQSVTSSWGGRRKLPLAFTEEGVAMLSSVLNSDRAVQVNILIMRAFVRLRRVLAANEALVRKLDELEGQLQHHDQAIAVLFEEVRKLIGPPRQQQRKRIGFRAPK
jgi:ORF6N domain